MSSNRPLPSSPPQIRRSPRWRREDPTTSISAHPDRSIRDALQAALEPAA